MVILSKLAMICFCFTISLTLGAAHTRARRQDVEFARVGNLLMWGALTPPSHY